MSQNPPDDTSPTTWIPDPMPQPEPQPQPQPELTDSGSTQTMIVPDQDAVAPVEPRRQIRMRTVVVGVVLLVIAVLTNLNVTTSVDFQLGTVVLALMIGCGVLLIVGATRRE